MKFTKTRNRILSVFTATAILWTATAASIKITTDEIIAYAAEETVMGDLNGDERIDAFDLAILKRKIAENDVTAAQAGDVNADGIVDAKDAMEVQDYLLHRITAFSGTIKKAFSSIDRTIVSKTVNGDEITGYETQLTTEMAALADSLNTPAEVFKYVLNNVDTEFYYGSRKGAIGTYEQNGGNDFDQASLMIALLRYLGYTANYAIGNIVITENDLLNMTATSNIEAAIAIYTSQDKSIESYESGRYITEHALVHLELDGQDMFLNPSLKYYALKDGAINLDNIIADLEKQYDLNDTSLNLNEVSYEIAAAYDTQTVTDAFPRYEIVQQDINNPLPFDVPSGKVSIYASLPDSMTNNVELYLGDARVLAMHSARLYNKNLTIEYEFTELAQDMMETMYGYDSIDDLTGDLGTASGYAQIYAVVKLDGERVANGNSALLGSKEKLRIDITSAGYTRSFEKELIYGSLYSVVFDYQIISPHDIAESYSKLPQSVTEQAKITDANVYGSEWLMDTLSLLGKTYFSQVDTNNAMLAEFQNIHYERSLSVAIVDFTPYMKPTTGGMALDRRGTIGIDVIGNQTIFKNRDGDTTEESKLRHSAGYLSSYYESEVIEQFTGLQAVSTAEVLSRAAEQDVDILYLSKANISELENSELSSQNKADITVLLNEGMYVTVPNAEITIDAWTGTGYIVYDPVTDLSSYIINTNLNGGSICSWVELAYLADILATVVECTWAYQLIMLGATILGAGLILFSGPIGAALLVTAIGLGLIVSGGFYIKNIGDRLYESTELMNRYLDGDTSAGEQLKSNSGYHVGFVALGQFGGKLLAKPATWFFNKIHLEQMVGKFVANAFANTPGGYTQAVEILNRISPEYTAILTQLVEKYGSSIADDIAKIDDSTGTRGIEKALDTIDDTARTAQDAGISLENIAKMEQQIAKASANNSKFTKPTIPEGSTPKGKYATPSNPNDPINVESITRQNDAANLLASKGYDITLLPENSENIYGLQPGITYPDYLIDGNAFDCYSPTTANPRNVWYNVQEKTQEQARRVILNLDGYTGASIDDIASQFLDWNIPTLDELLVIKDETIIRLIIK